MKKAILALVAMLLLGLTVAAAQEKHEDETTAQVPALGKFHQPIYKLWHQAWPKKDIEMLKKLLPDVEAAYKNLAEAKLPGILRDKQTRWDEGLKVLGATVADYRKAVDANDSAAIISSTEKVHANYEAMVRVIRPVLKEIEAFHQVLYMYYHYYVPEYNKEKIAANVDSLVVKMQALNEAKLPERMKKREEGFVKARTALGDAVKSFAEVVKADKPKDEVKKSLEFLHTKYQDLEKVFE